VLIETAIGLH